MFAKRALHLLKLGHQICLCVLPPGGIAQKKVDFASRSDLIRFVTKRRRISIVLASNHFNAEPFGPNAELFDGSGAKSVACRQQNSMSIHSTGAQDRFLLK